LVTAPVIEPVSLAEAKAHLRVTVPDDDALLAGYINTARRFAEGYVRGAVITQTWDHTIDFSWPTVLCNGYWIYRIELPLQPVQSVTSVSYVDESGNTQTLSAGLYTVHKDRPVCHIDKAYNAVWPNVRIVPAAITVRFVAGYLPANVPDELRSAMLLHIETLYDRNPADREALEFARNALLDPYRVLRVA
jgi:uncharacterized phiE125 gp8 family phage protein